MNRNRILLTAVTLVLVLSGCVRSISNSGYDAEHGRYGSRGSNPFYRGELSEFDVLGIDRAKYVTDNEIAQALSTRKQISVKRGSSLMVIQSGAAFPDEPIVKALEKYYNVGSFTGVPPETRPASHGTMPAESYARALRLAAARGGYETVVVYWGILETARENLATKTVSWVPVVGWVLPDERQRMRIRLKFAMIDTRTGQWETFSPEPFDDSTFSNIVGRRQSDQDQVALLKDKAYVAAAEELARRYGR